MNVTDPALNAANPALQASIAAEPSDVDKSEGGVVNWIKNAVSALTPEPLSESTRFKLILASATAFVSVASSLCAGAVVSAFTYGMASENLAAAVAGFALTPFAGVIALGNVATCVMQASSGDVPGAVLTGAKLIAMFALTAHPVPFAIIVAADAAYRVYSAVSDPAYSEAFGDTE